MPGTIPPNIDIPSTLAKCPDHDALFMAFMQLMPPGAAWDNTELTLDRNSTIRKFISGLALSWMHFENDMCAALDEWFCLTSTVDEDLWKLDYGIPDECDIYNASVCAKVAASAGASPTAEMLNLLLESNGYLGAGRWLTGHDVEYPGVRSTFHFVLDPTISLAASDVTVLPFPLGVGRLLGRVPLETQAAQVQCMLERYIPAHCVVDVTVGGTFDPSHVGAKLKAWWTADSTVDGAVASWEDEVASIAATGPSGAQPVSAVAGGYRWLTFDGVDDYLRTASLALHPAGSAASEMFAIVDNAATDAPRRYIAQHNDDERAISFEDAAPSRLSVLDETDILVDALNPANGIVSVAGTFSGSAIAGRVNGVPTDPASFAATLTTTSPAPLTIGASGVTVPTNFLNGKMRHLIVTQGATMHEIMQIEAWLLWDIGRADLLPGDHPYKNVPP